MGKPPIEVFDHFKERFYQLTRQAGKKQYLVPYLVSSHPGSELKDAVILAEYLWRNHMKPEQVQDFYPTPGTVSTCMYHTGLDPYTLKPVFVEKTREGKAMQRALLQYYEPKNAQRVRRALELTHREDLIPLLLGSSHAPGQVDRPVRAHAPKPAQKGRQTGYAGRRPAARGAKSAPGRITLTPWKGSEHGKKTEKKR